MWPAVIAAVMPLLDKLIPDPEEAAKAKVQLMEMQQRGELAQLEAGTQIALAQSTTNTVEAASTRLFVAGWRPFVGWICACAVGFKYIGGPLLVMIATFFGHPVDLPDIDTDDLWPLLGGMLGLGALRTVEKVKKVA